MPLVEKAPGCLEVLDTRLPQDPADAPGHAPLAAPNGPSPPAPLSVRESIERGTPEQVEDALFRDAVKKLTDRQVRNEAGFHPDLSFPGEVRETIGF